jgi:hypothetical protein
MADTKLPDYIGQARSRAEEAASTAGQMTAGGYTIADELKKVLNEALDYNKDILEPRATALSDYMAAPAQARARFNTPTLATGEANRNYIFNPFEANKAIADYVKTKEIPFLALNSILGFRQQGEADLLRSATGAYNAEVAAAQAASEAARQVYSDVLNEFKTSEDIRLREADLKNTGGYTATAAKEKQELIKEAAKLPQDKRRDYILANGYNPDDADFSGLFTSAGIDLSQAGNLKSLGVADQYTYDPATGKIIPKPASQGWIPDWIPLVGRF